jgi:flavin-binding protein dodecin
MLRALNLSMEFEFPPTRCFAALVEMPWQLGLLRTCSKTLFGVGARRPGADPSSGGQCSAPHPLQSGAILLYILNARGRLPHRSQSGLEEDVMAESVYKIIEIVGTSPTSWEKAAAAAVERAATTLRDLRVAEVSEQDIVISDGKVEAYRVRLKISFKFED